jgi:hypothetical protein
MLIACKTSRTENRLQLAKASRRPELWARIQLAGTRIKLITGSGPRIGSFARTSWTATRTLP